MAVKIRLKRLGKIRSPHYRIVVADSRTKRDGRAIEEIGKYHPKNDPSVIEVNSERAQYWLSVGAQPTEAVVALFKRTGDWQSYSGDTSPSGVEPQREKKNKLDAVQRRARRGRQRAADRGHLRQARPRPTPSRAPRPRPRRRRRRRGRRRTPATETSRGLTCWPTRSSTSSAASSPTLTTSWSRTRTCAAGGCSRCGSTPRTSAR